MLPRLGVPHQPWQGCQRGTAGGIFNLGKSCSGDKSYHCSSRPRFLASNDQEVEAWIKLLCSASGRLNSV